MGRSEDTGRSQTGKEMAKDLNCLGATMALDVEQNGRRWNN